MARNYDTTKGTPYTRVDRLEIEYAQAVARVRICESRSVVLANVVHQIAKSESAFLAVLPITSETVTAPIPLVDPATGQPTGETTTLAEAIMVLTALCRQQQLLRDQSEG